MCLKTKALYYFILVLTVSLLFNWSGFHSVSAQRGEDSVELPVISSYSDYKEHFLPNLDRYFDPNSEEPVQEESEDLELLKPIDHSAKVIGTYVQINYQRTMNFEVASIGHVGIKVGSEDSDEIIFILYPQWHSNAIRPMEEIEEYEGKQVVVAGEVWTYVPSPPPPPLPPIPPEADSETILNTILEPDGASLMNPCIFPMESIELAE